MPIKKSNIFIFVTLTILIISCNNKIDKIENTEVCYHEVFINNKILKTEIAEYINFVNQHAIDSNIVIAYFSILNDSTTHFEITYSYRANVFRQNPFLFTVKVNNKVVFFCVKENIIIKDNQTNNFFNNDTLIIYNIMKEYLPNEYKSYLRFKETGILERNHIFDDGVNILDLIFVKDKLFKKRMRRGHIQKIY